MSTALNDQNTPSDPQERIYRALKMTVEAFFEAREGDIQAAATWVDSLKSTWSPTRILRIEEGSGLTVD